MNFKTIPAQIMCTRCNTVQGTGSESCSGCGISFIFGKPDGWQHSTLSDSVVISG